MCVRGGLIGHGRLGGIRGKCRGIRYLWRGSCVGRGVAERRDTSCTQYSVPPGGGGELGGDAGNLYWLFCHVMSCHGRRRERLGIFAFVGCFFGKF